MVSPVSKGGFGATLIYAVSPDGERVAFYSPGVFDEAPSTVLFGPDYLAGRGEREWLTKPTPLPASMSVVNKQNPKTDFSPDLTVELAESSPVIHEYEPQDELDTWLRSTSLPDTPENWKSLVNIYKSAGHEVALLYRTASVDFCHLILQNLQGGGNPIPEAEGTTLEIYQVNRCGGQPGAIGLVGVNNNGKLIEPNCHTDLGDIGIGEAGIRTTEYNALSEDGSEAFFTDCPTSSEEHHQLYMRLGGTRTVEVSRPLEAGTFNGCVGEGKGPAGEVPCEGASTRAAANFIGASEDGSKVYFTAPLEGGQPPLAPGDTDASNNVYAAEIGCPQAKPGCAASEREVTSLSEVSHDPNNAPAGVQGFLRVAPDGQRVYFVASGDLLTPAQQLVLEEEGRPAPRVGAANLYVYDAKAGGVSFIAQLCTSAERSGTAEDFHCAGGESDEKLWRGGGQEGGESQTGGPGGEFLVFSTYGQLTSEDVNTARDVYRYDALTGALTLVSHGENGYEPNAARATVGARIEQGSLVGDLFEQHGLRGRAISEDGSRIVFTSAEPLSRLDTDGLSNAYEWHEGVVSLVSSGSDPEGVGGLGHSDAIVISADGSSVAFATAQSLVAQDTDVLSDVYVARLGENFAQPPAERKPCKGDGCQGPLTNPAPLLVPGSVSQAPGENVLPPAKTKAKAKAKPKCKRGNVRDKHGRCVKRRRRASAGRSRSSSNRGGRS